MAIDSQAKRMSCIAVSHYAMSPSVLADGSIGAEDRAAAGYGFYYDIVSVVTDDLATKYIQLNHLREPMMISGG